MPSPSNSCASLDEVRANIDRIDRGIVRLLAERESYVRQAARFKTTAADVVVPQRIEQVVANVTALARELGADPAVAEQVYRTMIAEFIRLETLEHQTLNRG